MRLPFLLLQSTHPATDPEAMPSDAPSAETAARAGFDCSNWSKLKGIIDAVRNANMPVSYPDPDRWTGLPIYCGIPIRCPPGPLRLSNRMSTQPRYLLLHIHLPWTHLIDQSNHEFRFPISPMLSPPDPPHSSGRCWIH